VVVDRVGQQMSWGQEAGVRTRSFMSWDQLREQADAGWTIGSHTMTHRSLVELSDEDLRHELCTSKQVIEATLGRQICSVSYPYGRFDGRVMRAAESAGYEIGAALGTPEPSMMAIPRVGIYRTTGMLSFRLKVLRARRWPQ